MLPFFSGYFSTISCNVVHTVCISSRIICMACFINQNLEFSSSEKIYIHFIQIDSIFWILLAMAHLYGKCYNNTSKYDFVVIEDREKNNVVVNIACVFQWRWMPIHHIYNAHAWTSHFLSFSACFINIFATDWNLNEKWSLYVEHIYVQSSLSDIKMRLYEFSFAKRKNALLMPL